MRKLISLSLSALMVFGMSATATAAQIPADYNYVMSGVSLSTPQTLNVTTPATANVNTTDPTYYLKGTSDPSQPLYMNGYEVTTRGAKGSFGVFVALAPGANSCTFTQGGVSKTVIINRTNAGTSYATTKTLTELFPTSDTFSRSGSVIKVTVIAPAGGSVTASLAGQTIQLRQNVAGASTGVPAYFSGELLTPAANSVTSLGKVSYSLSFNGNVTYHTSAGQIYAAPQNAPVVVQVTDTVVNLFKEDSLNSSFLAVLRYGALDTVTESGKLYRLASGGWVPKSAVVVRPDVTGVFNSVRGVTFQQGEKEEAYIINGTSFPTFTSSLTADKLTITFNNTSGLPRLPIENSSVFSDSVVTELGGGKTQLELTIRPGAVVWGYLVEYKDGGITQLSVRYKPVLYGGEKPLAGTVVCIDAGHGGNDPGAIGIPWTTGPMESQINLAHAIALKNKLELLGAKVIMVRETDVNSTMNSRVMLAERNRADFYISLHSNAIGGNGIGKGGTEVYYYEDISAKLASGISSRVAASTGRSNRGAKYSSMKVTLDSFGPSVLVELGFVSNPVEYDSLIDSWNIYQTATAISQSIIDALR